MRRLWFAELEERKLAAPSTYASISTIQERGYVRTENKRFYVEKIGEVVTDRLSESFKDLMSMISLPIWKRCSTKLQGLKLERRVECFL